MTDVGITIGSIVLDSDNVRDLMDKPSKEFLSDNTVVKIIKRCYGWINGETKISEYDAQDVVDAVYSFAVWQTYMVYVESISEYFQQQSAGIVMKRLEEFQSIAILYLRSIGIVWPLDKNGELRGMDVEHIKINYGYSNASGVLTLSDVYDD